MHNDYLAHVFETSSLYESIPGDDDGPYPWRRCVGVKCRHRLAGTRGCVCAARAWTHFVVVAPHRRSIGSLIDAIERKLTNLRQMHSHTPVSVAYSKHCGHVVLLVAAPWSAQMDVYELLDACGYDTDDMNSMSNFTTKWKLLAQRP